MTRKPYQNPSGCKDLTPLEAINNIARDERRQAASEAHEQAAVFDWAAWNQKRYPSLRLLYAIPNGEYRPKATGKKLKQQGVKPGVSDMHLPVARMGYHGLWIEMKAKAGRVSQEQAQWINDMHAEGYAAFVCYGAKEAISVLVWYLGE